jgi:aldose 1-epimerase
MIMNVRSVLTLLLVISGMVLILPSCNTKKEAMQEPGTIIKQPFGILPDSTEVSLYTLVNHSGVIMKVTNYGGIITSLQVPDKNGKPADIVLGYDSLSGYLAKTPYFGALIGRYGNRIAKEPSPSTEQPILLP